MPYTKDIRDYLVRNHISIEVKVSSAGGNKRWKCRMCSKEFCSSQSRMVGHLIGGVGISKCKNMSDEAVVAFLRFREARREGHGLDLVALSNERENIALSDRINGGNGFVGEGALVEIRTGGGGPVSAGQEGVAALDEGVALMLHETGASPQIVRYVPMHSIHFGIVCEGRSLSFVDRLPMCLESNHTRHSTQLTMKLDRNGQKRT